MSWRQFVMELRELEAPRVEEVFINHGALAVSYSDAADDPVLEPLPGETPLWKDTLITGLFPAEADIDSFREDLRRALEVADLPPSRVETLEDRAWEREWLKDFRPMRFGRRLWVCPVEARLPEPDSVVIRLDPGLAFGTGAHATTALCLERLEALALNEKRLLDFGCGSGILAIGSILLGAREAMAFDIDPQAITATMNNARQNSVADRVTTTLVSADVGEGYDVVVANILARPLLELAPGLCARLSVGGTLILSGILAAQCGALRERYRPWIEFDDAAYRDGWACLSGTRIRG